MRRYIYIIGLSLLIIGLSACGGDSSQPSDKGNNEKVEDGTTDKEENKPDEATNDTADYPTTIDGVEGFPDWLPLPKEYSVVIDMEVGHHHTVSLETTEPDIMKMAERMLAELEAAGYDTSTFEDNPSDDGEYGIKGMVHTKDSTGSILIHISAGKEDLQLGNSTGFVLYRMVSN